MQIRPSCQNILLQIKDEIKMELLEVKSQIIGIDRKQNQMVGKDRERNCVTALQPTPKSYSNFSKVLMK